METEKLIELISDHLQEVNSDPTERLKRIDEMLDFLNFNSRLTKLSDEEKQDFTYCNEGYPRTEEMQASYDNADEERREYLLDMWARSTYMRLCMWRGYLSGNTDKKPTILTLANAA